MHDKSRAGVSQEFSAYAPVYYYLLAGIAMLALVYVFVPRVSVG